MSTTFYLSTSVNIPYALSYSVIPPTVQVGNTQQYPFKLTLSAADTNDHIIDLYAQYSGSQPYTEQNKWSHLIPTWRFLDTDGNIVTKIKTNDTPILSGTEVIGVTGECEFYYIDDISSKLGEPVIIWSTLSVSSLPLYSESNNGEYPIPSYANSKIVVALPYYINGGIPDKLNITRNGINSMSDSTYWIDQSIPNIVTISYDSYPEFGCSSDSMGILFDYPSSNQLGLDMGKIALSLATVPISAQTWTTLDDISGPYFQAYDTNLFKRGGYSRNIVKSTETSLNTYITAGVNVSYDSYKYTPFIWISNPDNNLLYKFRYPYVNQSIINNITSWLSGFSTTGQFYSFNTEYLNNRPDVMSLTGFGGIYGFAIDPCFNVFASDAELDKIYKFNNLGVLVSSIDLSDTSTLGVSGLTGGCTPAGICLDSTNKLWVTLFDSTSVLKFDGTTGQLLTIINAGGNLGTIDTDPDFKPTMVQSDKDDNIWVSYTNSLYSCLYKYDTTGLSLTTVTLPVCSNPMDLIVDKDNNVWVSLTYHAIPSAGNVNKYSENGLLLSSISAYHPEYLTLDNQNNLWFTYGFNNIQKVDLTTASITTTSIGISTIPNLYGDQLFYNALEGIAADSSNRIWIINSLESKVYVLSGDSILNIYEIPTNRTQFIIDDDLSQLELVNPYEKSIQSFGDWTGLRWYQKYATTTQQYLTGQSELFNIDSFYGYDFRKFNESWDATTQIRNYALNENLYSNYNLFVNYIGTMIGGLETSANSIARRIFEKIANFVPNNADADVCGVNQLYSLANSVDVPIDDYNFTYPSELQRLMDILSIDHKKIWGSRCKCSSNYRGAWGYCSNCGHKHDSNRGNALDTDTYIVSSNIPFLAEYKFDRDYYEKITPKTSGGTLYNVSSAYLLNDPTYYCFYEYIPTICNIQVEGVISWDDEYTTLSENVSGIDEWYGNNQIVEKIINYSLHKGLGF